jgi:hypothetical protein
MTRKDFTMNWDQIEHKWAAMTSRVRADWTIARPEALPKLPRRGGRADETPTVLADRRVGLDEPARSKTPTE